MRPCSLTKAFLDLQTMKFEINRKKKILAFIDSENYIIEKRKGTKKGVPGKNKRHY